MNKIMNIRKKFSNLCIITLIGLSNLALVGCSGAADTEQSGSLGLALGLITDGKKTDFSISLTKEFGADQANEIAKHQNSGLATKSPTSFNLEVLNPQATAVSNIPKDGESLYDYRFLGNIFNHSIKNDQLYFVAAYDQGLTTDILEVFVADLAIDNPVLSSLGGGVALSDVDKSKPIGDISKFNPPSFKKLNIYPEVLAFNADWLYLISFNNLVFFKLDSLQNNKLASSTVMEHKDLSAILALADDDIFSFKVAGDDLYLTILESGNTRFLRLHEPQLETITCFNASQQSEVMFPYSLDWQVISDYIYTLAASGLHNLCIGENVPQNPKLALYEVRAETEAKAAQSLGKFDAIIEAFNQAYVLSVTENKFYVISNVGKLEQTLNIPSTYSHHGITYDVDFTSFEDMRIAVDQKEGAIYSFSGNLNSETGGYIVKLTPVFKSEQAALKK